MSRLIYESAVEALVQGKIDALERRIEERRFPDGGAGAIALGEAKAKISALRSVIGHLKFCPSADVDPMGAGGVFPISEAEES